MNTTLLNNFRIKSLVLTLIVLLVLVGQFGCSASTTEESVTQDSSPESATSEESMGVHMQSSEVHRISSEELLQKIESEAGVLIVDTRSKGYYEQGHIKGAVSIPYSEIMLRKWQPSPDQEVVLYCD